MQCPVFIGVLLHPSLSYFLPGGCERSCVQHHRRPAVCPWGHRGVDSLVAVVVVFVIVVVSTLPLDPFRSALVRNRHCPTRPARVLVVFTACLPSCYLFWSIIFSVQVASSGDYRSGFCYVICRVPAGLYTILPSTYRPSAGGSFSLIVGASAAMIRVHALPADGGMQSQVGLGSGVLTARVSRWAFFNGLPPSPPKCPARSHSLGPCSLAGRAWSMGLCVGHSCGVQQPRCLRPEPEAHAGSPNRCGCRVAAAGA